MEHMHTLEKNIKNDPLGFRYRDDAIIGAVCSSLLERCYVIGFKVSSL